MPLEQNERGMKDMTTIDNIAKLLIYLFNYAKKIYIRDIKMNLN